MSPEALTAVAALASALAALVALMIIWRAPIAAAKYAEEIRTSNDRRAEARRQKLYVFTELMKARGVQVNRDAVAAFNLIDLVFKESPEVRDAWAELYSGYNRFRHVPPTYIEERLTILLKTMANDLGVSEDLRSADFERYYYPEALAEEDRARVIHQKAMIELQHMQADQSSPQPPKSLFPPKPPS